MTAISSFRFADAFRPDRYGFIIDKDSWDTPGNAFRRRGGLAVWARRYDTLGDGQTQHAPEMCCENEDWIPFLASLAIHLDAEYMDVTRRMQEVDLLASLWPRNNVERAQVAGLMKVKYDPEKTWRYYEKFTGKMSSNGNKSYDKRWDRIPEHADGSFDGVWMLGHQDWTTGSGMIEAYAAYTIAKETAQVIAGPDYRVRDPYYFFEMKKFVGDTYDWDTETAFNAVKALVDEGRARALARRCADSCNNLAAKARKPAAAEVEA